MNSAEIVLKNKNGEQAKIVQQLGFAPLSYTFLSSASWKQTVLTP